MTNKTHTKQQSTGIMLKKKTNTLNHIVNPHKQKQVTSDALKGYPAPLLAPVIL